MLPASCKNASGSMADRCGQFCKGPQTKDPNFVYMQHGQLHRCETHTNTFTVEVCEPDTYGKQLNCQRCLVTDAFLNCCLSLA